MRTLQEITKRLLELEPELHEALNRKMALQYEVDKAKANLYLSDSIQAYRNQEMRDAAVSQILEMDGNLEPLYKARGDVSMLSNERDILIEASRNLRSLGLVESAEVEVKIKKGKK